MYEATDLKSISGEVFKIAEVQTESNQTSVSEQTYTFNFRLEHAVPMVATSE